MCDKSRSANVMNEVVEVDGFGANERSVQLMEEEMEVR